jgi:hypothetical protein
MSITNDLYDKGTACTLNATTRRPRSSSVGCDVIPLRTGRRAVVPPTEVACGSRINPAVPCIAGHRYPQVEEER